MTLVYHEKQESRLCGKHCLNNLLQGEMFNQRMLRQIAEKLDKIEQRLLFEDETDISLDQSEHHSREGDFSIEVLLAALGRVNVELLSARHPNAAVRVAEEAFKAIVVQSRNHWFALRKVADAWFNLDSLLERPSVISVRRLMRWLGYLPHGVNAFLVIGELPPPETPRNEPPWIMISDVESPEAPEKFTPHREPTDFDTLIDLGFSKEDVNVALGISQGDIGKAHELLSLAPFRGSMQSKNSRGSTLDSQMTSQVTSWVKGIYLAKTPSIIAQNFFQICRLSASYPSVGKKILLSSLRDALEAKQSFLGRGIRDEIAKLYKMLEMENPSYKRLKDMNFKDLVCRCAMILYPTELDEACEVLLQPLTDAQELFVLLHASTNEGDIRGFLLRVIQVAAGHPASVPTKDFLESIQGQKKNLGMAGLQAASLLLEYLDSHQSEDQPSIKPAKSEPLPNTHAVSPNSPPRPPLGRTPSSSSTAKPSPPSVGRIPNSTLDSTAVKMDTNRDDAMLRTQSAVLLDARNPARAKLNPPNSRYARFDSHSTSTEDSGARREAINGQLDDRNLARNVVHRMEDDASKRERERDEQRHDNHTYAGGRSNPVAYRATPSKTEPVRRRYGEDTLGPVPSFRDKAFTDMRIPAPKSQILAALTAPRDVNGETDRSSRGRDRTPEAQHSRYEMNRYRAMTSPASQLSAFGSPATQRDPAHEFGANSDFYSRLLQQRQNGLPWSPNSGHRKDHGLR